jgi:hypothetical protein
MPVVLPVREGGKDMRDAMKIAEKMGRLTERHNPFDTVGGIITWVMEKNRKKGFPLCEYDDYQIEIDIKYYMNEFVEKHKKKRKPEWKEEVAHARQVLGGCCRRSR